MKKFLALTLCLLLCGTLLAGCGEKKDPATNGDPEASKVTSIKVAASPTPHAEILEVAKEVLAQEGITLEIVEMTDYLQPNFAAESGDVLANYFQHIAYLDKFNADNSTHLVNVAEIHYEPYGLYPGKTASIEALAPGAVIAVPNDPSNEARALRLLEVQGLIKLDPNVGLEATKLDIVENKLDLKFEELEAAQLPATLPSVDMAVINGNYAIGAGLNVTTDAIAIEKDTDSESAALYANVLAVKEGSETDPAVQALVKAMQSDKVRDFITSQYEGAVVPLF